MERPKRLPSLSNSGTLNPLQTAINIGKRVARTTSESIQGRRMRSAKGSILAEHEIIHKFQIENEKPQLPKPGCGFKEVSRRLKQLKNYQHSVDKLSPTQRSFK